MHLSIIISSSMGRSGSCKTQGGRGSMPGPRQMEGRPQHLPQGLPPSLATPSPAPSQEVRLQRGGPTSISLNSTLNDLQKGFSCTQQNWLLGCFQDPIRERGGLSKLYPNAHPWRTVNYTTMRPPSGYHAAVGNKRNKRLSSVGYTI